MKRVLIILLGISFLCNGCSHGFSLYIRNFYETPIVFSLDELKDLVPMYKKRIAIAHEVIKINRSVDNKFTDSLIIETGSDVKLPPYSTNKIGMGFIGAGLHPFSNRKNTLIHVVIGDSVKAIKLAMIKKKNKYQYYLDIKP